MAKQRRKKKAAKAGLDAALVKPNPATDPAPEPAAGKVTWAPAGYAPVVPAVGASEPNSAPTGAQGEEAPPGPVLGTGRHAIKVGKGLRQAEAFERVSARVSDDFTAERYNARTGKAHIIVL